MKNAYLLPLLSLLVAGPVLAGGSSTVGPGNPAAILCTESGGHIVTINSEAGQGGLCVFGNSGAIEEWTFWRYKDAGRSLAVEAFLGSRPSDSAPHNGIGMPSPASVHCKQVGGSLTIQTLNDGGQIGLCEFSDRSAIEEWTLFRGPSDPLNAKLVQALR